MLPSVSPCSSFQNSIEIIIINDNAEKPHEQCEIEPQPEILLYLSVLTILIKNCQMQQDHSN